MSSSPGLFLGKYQVSHSHLGYSLSSKGLGSRGPSAIQGFVLHPVLDNCGRGPLGVGAFEVRAPFGGKDPLRVRGPLGG